MKIGFDAKRIFHNTSGLGNYGRDLVRILAEYYPNNRYFLYNPKPKKVNRLQLTPTILEVLPKHKIWRMLSSWWRQGPIIAQLERDAIDIFHGLSGEIPKGVEKTAIKSIVTIHDLIFIRYPKLYSYFDRKIHLNKVQFSARNAHKIIAISEQTKRDIVTYLGVDEKKVSVIYQGCHSTFKEIKTEKFKAQVVKKFNLPTKFILNVGAINERKNVLCLIKAIEKLDTPLIIIGGKTSYFKVLETYIEKHHLQNKVRFLENVDMQELSAIYQMASVFVYPSIFEGFGIPIIEALYSKTPVITSKGSCFSEAGGPDSIYVTPNDVVALSQNIQLVLEHADVRTAMIEKGVKFAQKFNDDVIAKEYYKVYKSVLS